MLIVIETIAGGGGGVKADPPPTFSERARAFAAAAAAPLPARIRRRVIFMSELPTAYAEPVGGGWPEADIPRMTSHLAV